MALSKSKIAQLSLLEEELVLLAVAMKKKKKREHRFWVHPIIQRRQQHGVFHHLVQELQFDGQRFKDFFRLTREQFRLVLTQVEEQLVRHSRTREVICPRQRLAICLRFLATGESFRSLGFSFRVGAATIRKIVDEVCAALWDKLSSVYLPMPADEETWRLIAENFARRWNFPHCVGALDGKHVVSRAPPNTGSLYHNYKGSFSAVLLALVDASYKFLAVDIGAYGRNSDGGIFANSNLGKALAQNALNLPQDSTLPQGAHLGPLPYVFVADEAFPLQTHIMRPFPGRGCSLSQRLFNYRLSRARRIVENAFGILVARWRIFDGRLNVSAHMINQVVKATVVLHNMLQAESTPAHVTTLFDEAASLNVEGLQNMARVGNRAGPEPSRIRDTYTEYFCNVQPVPWQLQHVQRGMFMGGQ